MIKSSTSQYFLFYNFIIPTDVYCLCRQPKFGLMLACDRIALYSGFRCSVLGLSLSQKEHGIARIVNLNQNDVIVTVINRWV